MTDWLWAVLLTVFVVTFFWFSFFGRVASRTKGLGYAVLMFIVPSLLFSLARVGDMGWGQVWPLVLLGAGGVLAGLALVLVAMAGETRERERATAEWLAGIEERHPK